MATKKKRSARSSSKAGRKAAPKAAPRAAGKKPAAKKATVKKAPPKARSSRPKVKAKRGGVRPRETPKEIAVFDPDRVMEVFDVMPSEDQLQAAADLLSGLAHQSRLKAVVALSMHELCVGDISAIVGLSLSATSTLLKQLRALGYVSARGAGKQTYYRVQGNLAEALLGTVFAAVNEAA